MSPMTDDPNFTYPAEALRVAHARGKHEAAAEILTVLRGRLPDAAKVGKIAAVLDDLVGPFDAEPLAASSSPAWEPQWQPIETAPKDDTNVLLWWPFWVKNRPTIGWFGHRGIQQWVCPEACEGDGEPPTHWMPLPPPPKDHP